MPKLYAVDVDETLEISNGPVTLQSLMDLRVQGHIVGICGNWGLFCQIPGWHHVASFVSCCYQTTDVNGKVLGDKGWYLSELKKYIPAEEYIMVGNVMGATNKLGFKCNSADSEAAARAGYRFIKEDDFANGSR